MKRLLRQPAAVYLWLAVTLVGAVAAAVVGHAGWEVVGWVIGGVAAAVVVAGKTGRAQ